MLMWMLSVVRMDDVYVRTFQALSPVYSYWYQNMPATIPLMFQTCQGQAGETGGVVRIWT